ncbi:HTTM domain-containing protein [Psychroflexus montanilacus]|uniref:HTTM domain-containing protein n=1 Tax=Psychroflexus montanilacus TaxID=2873598 RepID=UPI001CCCD81C|nr:HTTM domain-containing protein [Psychroflexus montanilacus]MBZ9651653.1 HTTM domain-containing protein [Psychroflexus montanilacus]
MNRLLFKQVDNSPLIVFRIFFGLLIALEAWGAIATGWVRRTLVEPQFTFNFIGFDFLQPLPGPGMYFYFGLMGLFGIFVMLGFKYRFSIIAYTLLWSCVYFMQKTSYNNHYYLLILLLIFMCIVPAHNYFSIDAKKNPELKSISMPNWVVLFIIGQIWIVYTYASLAKLYPDWLDGTFPELLMKGRAHYWLIGDLLQEPWVHMSICIFGILFDLLVVPLLLWKRTRKAMFIASIFFHLFNSIVFQIGIFPYMSLAFTVFFFPKEYIHRKFLKSKAFYEDAEVKTPHLAPLLKTFFAIWFTVQLILPVRHHFIEGNVFWTEEGHKLSWRMMLRSKGGFASFKIKNLNTGKTEYVKLDEYLTTKQRRNLLKPDGIYQFTQRLKKEYAEKDIPIEIYARVKVSLNGRKAAFLIDPKLDLTTIEWDYFFHNEWVLPQPDSISWGR